MIIVEVIEEPRGEILPGAREHHYSAPAFEFWIWQGWLMGLARSSLRRSTVRPRTIVRREWWAKPDDDATASGVIAPAARTKQLGRRPVAAVGR